jgi:hypothetical protein
MRVSLVTTKWVCGGCYVTDQETRKRLLINRHIAKMTPEEIARRFTVAYTVPVAVIKAATAKSGEGRKLKC